MNKLLKFLTPAKAADATAFRGVGIAWASGDIVPEFAGRRTFSAEVHMTAGPRKADDQGLGEDAGGFLLAGKQMGFWVADGTSESAVIGSQFSSRRLAQDLGREFADAFRRTRRQNPNFPELVVSGVISAVIDRWSNTLDDLMGTADGRDLLDQAFALDPDDLAMTGCTHHSHLDFSATFLCGRLSTEGALDYAISGDCKLLAHGRKAARISYPESRLFLRLRRMDSDSYRFITSDPRDLKVGGVADVTLVAAGSDGIGRLDAMMAAQLGRLPIGTIRDNLHRFAPGTHDDKTLVVIELEDDA